MVIFDVVLIVILCGFIFYGLFFGLLRALGSLVALIVAIWFTSISYKAVFAVVGALAFGYDTIGRGVLYVIMFIIINRLVKLGFSFVESALDFIDIIPFFSIVNRLIGAIFGFFIGAILIGLLFKAASSHPASSVLVHKYAEKSVIVPYLATFTALVMSILPDSLSRVKNAIINLAKDYGA